jgi:hypothetical protein
MIEDDNPFAAVGEILDADAAVKSTLFWVGMMTGRLRPDWLARRLRELERQAIKAAHDPGQLAAATQIHKLRVRLFGENDTYLPARQLQAHRARQRENRIRHARGY